MKWRRQAVLLWQKEVDLMDMETLMKMMLSTQAVSQVSEQTGISAQDAASVIEDVLPMLLQGMQGQAKNESTKAGFLDALQAHGEEDASDVGKFLKNVDTDDGDKIVSHLLGSNKEEVAAKAKKKSGIDTKTVLKIMAILAPLLMTQLGKSAKEETANSNGGMADVVGNMLKNVDVGDVIKIASLFLK
jgi:hypothetical protein